MDASLTVGWMSDLLWSDNTYDVIDTTFTQNVKLDFKLRS